MKLVKAFGCVSKAFGLNLNQANRLEGRKREKAKLKRHPDRYRSSGGLRREGNSCGPTPRGHRLPIAEFAIGRPYSVKLRQVESLAVARFSPKQVLTRWNTLLEGIGCDRIGFLLGGGLSFFALDIISVVWETDSLKCLGQDYTVEPDGPIANVPCL